MASSHKSITVLRCKVAMVGDAHVGKSAVKEMFHSGGQHYPKNYVMVCISWRSLRIPSASALI